MINIEMLAIINNQNDTPYLPGHIEGCEILSEEVSKFFRKTNNTFAFLNKNFARLQFLVIGLVLSLIVHDQFSL